MTYYPLILEIYIDSHTKISRFTNDSQNEIDNHFFSRCTNINTMLKLSKEKQIPTFWKVAKSKYFRYYNPTLHNCNNTTNLTTMEGLEFEQTIDEINLEDKEKTIEPGKGLDSCIPLSLPETLYSSLIVLPLCETIGKTACHRRVINFSVYISPKSYESNSKNWVIFLPCR